MTVPRTLSCRPGIGEERVGGEARSRVLFERAQRTNEQRDRAQCTALKRARPHGPRRSIRFRFLGAGDPVEKGIQRDGDDRGQKDARFQQRMQRMRQLPEEVRGNERNHSESDGDRDHKQIVAVRREVDPGQDTRAGGRHHAEHDQTGAAQHDKRHRLDQRRHLRDEAEHDHDEAACRTDPARAYAGDADEARRSARTTCRERC